MNRPRRRVPWVAAIIATLAFAGAAGFAGEDGPTTPDLDRLVEELGSEDSEVAANAAQGLFAAGAAAIPALFRAEGRCERFYAVDEAFHPVNTMQLRSSRGGGCAPDDQVSVEVAALYLLEAIYEGRMPFTCSPMLSDLTKSPDTRTTEINKPLVERAWASAKLWLLLVQCSGLEKVRAAHQNPLDAGLVHFW